MIRKILFKIPENTDILTKREEYKLKEKNAILCFNAGEIWRVLHYKKIFPNKFSYLFFISIFL
jgi:hypothetical protein